MKKYRILDFIVVTLLLLACILGYCFLIGKSDGQPTPTEPPTLPPVVTETVLPPTQPITATATVAPPTTPPDKPSTSEPTAQTATPTATFTATGGVIITPAPTFTPRPTERERREKIERCIVFGHNGPIPPKCLLVIYQGRR